MNASSLASSSSSANVDTTTVDGTTIRTPNTSIVDDTPNAILSRSVARVLSTGFHVRGIHTEEVCAPVKGRVGKQTWDVVVALSASGDTVGTIMMTVLTDLVPLREGGYRTVRSYRMAFLGNVEVERKLRLHNLEA